MKAETEGELAQSILNQGLEQRIVVEDAEHIWSGETITTADIRRLGCFSSEEIVIQVDPDAGEIVLVEETVITIKPGHRFIKRRHGDHHHHGDHDRHHLPVTVTVNGDDNRVVFDVHKATGAVIKATAIAQGVQIQQDFTLFERTKHGLKQIGDDETVDLHECEAFKATAPDDYS